MREIKFRMLVTSGDKPWHHWDLPQSIEDCRTAFNHYNLESWTQYTGLKDKNGVEIYEGDILEHSYTYIGKTEPHIRRFKVVFEDGAFTQWEPGDAENAFDIWYDWNELKIIGNIYQNPELLK